MMIALAIVGGLIALVIAALLLITLLRISGVLLVQWRDLLSIDRWTEVFDTIRRNKLRTALTMIAVSWGIFVLVFLLGLGKGLDNGLRHTFARDATNGIWMAAAKTSIAHDGYDLGRKLTFDNRDFQRARSAKVPGPDGPGIDKISGQFFIRGGQFGGGEMVTKYNGKANPFQINAVHPDAIYLASQMVESGRFLDFVDIESGHWPMVSKPIELARLLAAAAAED